MRSLLLLMALCGVLLSASCVDKQEATVGQVDLNFRAVYAGEPLVTFERVYDYEQAMRLRVQTFQFYLSDLALLRADGSTEALSEVALVNFSELTTAVESSQGVTLSFDDIPAGTYTGLRMGLGVSPSLNAQAPANFRQPHPLSDANYWSWALGYVFAKIEGNVDTNGDGVFQDKVSYHVGADSLYTVLTYTTPISVTKAGTTKLDFQTDLHSLLVNDAAFIDFRDAYQQLVHANKPELHSFIFRNLGNNVLMQR